MDYITITDNEGNELLMEVVTTFEMEGSEYKYIIYTETDRSNYYLAKYKDNIEELNTDITKKEVEFCEKILESVVKE